MRSATTEREEITEKASPCKCESPRREHQVAENAQSDQAEAFCPNLLTPSANIVFQAYRPSPYNPAFSAVRSCDLRPRPPGHAPNNGQWDTGIFLPLKVIPARGESHFYPQM